MNASISYKPFRSLVIKQYYKRTALLIVFCVLIGSLIGVQPVKAATQYNVRVGLTYKYKEVQSVAISEKSIVLGYNNYDSFSPIITMSASSGFTVSIPSGYYAKIGDGFRNYAEAKLQGSGTVLFTGSDYGLLRGPFSSQAEAQGYGALFSPAANSVLLSADGVPAVMFNSSMYMQISPAQGNETISLGDRRYRGAIEFLRYTGRNITAINVLPIDQYLYSVVQSEMPNAWHMEALKAQAVVARSYTIDRAGVHSSEGFELCDATHCQSYLGRGNEAQRTNEAVNATSGMFAYYGNEAINASYFSSSGGVTDNSENVWSNPMPYLKSVVEVAEREYRQWERTFTMTELTSLAKNSGSNIGTVQSVTVVHQSNARVGQLILNGTNGKKVLLKEEIRTFFSGTTDGSLLSRNFYIQGTNPPQITSQPSSSGGGSVSLRGADGTETNASPGGVYTINGDGDVSVPDEFVVLGSSSVYVYDDTNTGSPTKTTSQLPETTTQSTGSSVTFIGKGNGHGVGMSQYGAKGMAESGYTYKQIIEFYYTGVVVR